MKFECAFCSSEMVGWSDLSVTEHREFEEDHRFITLPACWTCRHEFDTAMKTEAYNSEFIEFVRKVASHHKQFKDRINGQYLEEV